MQFPLPIRLLIAVVLSVALALLLVLFLYLTDLVLSVWQQLERAPWWLIAGYVSVLFGIAAAGTWVLWRLLIWNRRRTTPRGKSAPKPPPRTAAELEAEVNKAEATGADVGTVRAELAALAERRMAGGLHVALFGDVNVGKSSTIQALLPEARANVHPVAGTTRRITRYAWTSPVGDELVLTDLPGLQEPGGSLDQLAREEALRAHVVVYLVEGDLTRSQHHELQRLLALGKPVILALNKTDRYTAEDRRKLRQRLQERTAPGQELELALVSVARGREVVRVHPDGREERVTQAVPPRVEELVSALQKCLAKNRNALDTLRDAAVFTLAGDKLDEALSEHRKTCGKRLVAEYTRKAVLGALAAVTPGTDVLIQGYLGIQLVKELCQLYDLPVDDIDVKKFLGLAARRVRKSLPITLGITGNALKAFPGIGTLTGGLAHAVAYGLLFDSLGRAILDTLSAGGTLPMQTTLQHFEERLGDNLEARASDLVRLAIREDPHTE